MNCGANVGLVGQDTESMKNMCKQGNFKNAVIFGLDLVKDIQIFDLKSSVVETLHNIDILVNCAGGAIKNAMIPEDQFSDLSEGMIDTAKEKLSKYENIEYKIIDIQDIPFEDDSFDIVIANSMLYHVPDINMGLKEVRRVLKDDGTFYCATFGEHGIIEYLSEVLKEYGMEDKTVKNFTLQNGEGILKTVFERVKRLDYMDSLAVTNIDDLIDYIYSLTSMTTLSQMHKGDIHDALTAQMVDGVLNVPKEYGMFICGA